MGSLFNFLFFLVLCSGAGSAQGNKNLKQEVKLCEGTSLCDPNFQTPIFVQHPNVEYLSGRQPKKFQVNNLYSSLGILGDKDMYWVLGNHWTSYHPLANSKKVQNSDFKGGFYRYNQPRGLKPLGQEIPVVRRALRNAMRLSEVSGKEVAEELRQMEVFSTPTQAFIFNRGDDKSVFGNMIISFDTLRENFGNKPFWKLGKDLKSEIPDEEKKKKLVGALIRNEEGLVDEITGGKPCENIERTFNLKKPSFYCKWAHFGMSQRFATPVSLENGFKLSTLVRLLDFKDFGLFNNNLKKHKLSRYFNHMNMRVILQRKRNKPIEFFDPRKGENVVREYDRISVNIAIYNPKELCLDPEFKVKNSICNILHAELEEKSTVAARPDIGTGTFMYQLGKEGYDMSVETGGADATEKIQKFAQGKALRISITDFPRLTQRLKAAIKRCNQKYTEWKIPQAWCDIEQTDWHRYDATTINFGSEVPGVFRTALQFNYINFETP